MGEQPRACFLRVARLIGVYHLFRWIHRRSITILFFHGVVNPDTATWLPVRSSLTTDSLKRQLDILSRYYQFISLEEAVDMLSGQRDLRHNCIACTIDDGYRNAVQEALPILRTYNITPTIFVVSGKMGRPVPYWFDRLDFALQHTARTSIRFCDRIVSWEHNNRPSMRAACKTIITISRESFSNDVERHKAISRLLEDLETDAALDQQDEVLAVLSAEEIAAVSESQASIGSHTVNHLRLAFIDAISANTELVISKQEIEHVTKRPCQFLCYPEGSYSDETCRMAKEAGYRAATSSTSGLNRVGDDPYRLKRTHLFDATEEDELLASISGFTMFLKTMIRPHQGHRG